MALTVEREGQDLDQPAASTSAEPGLRTAVPALRAATAVAAMAILALASLLAQRPAWLAAVAVSGLLFAIEDIQRRWPSDSWLALQWLTVAGVRQPESLLLPALLLALAHWDLEDFERRLAGTPGLFEGEQLIRRHLTYLLVALLIGGGLAAIALLGTLRLSFAGAVALAIVGLFGLSRMVRRD